MGDTVAEKTRQVARLSRVHDDGFAVRIGELDLIPYFRRKDGQNVLQRLVVPHQIPEGVGRLFMREDQHSKQRYQELRVGEGRIGLIAAPRPGPSAR